MSCTLLSPITSSTNSPFCARMRLPTTAHGHRGTGRFPDRVGDGSRSGATECLPPSSLRRRRGADLRIGGGGARHGHADAAPVGSDQSRGPSTPRVRARAEAWKVKRSGSPMTGAAGSCGSPLGDLKSDSLCLRILKGVRCCSLIVTLVSEVGWKLLDAEADPNAAAQAASG
jgi:hypothetical protein